MKTTATRRILFTLAILVGMAAAPAAQLFIWEPNRHADIRDGVRNSIDRPSPPSAARGNASSTRSNGGSISLSAGRIARAATPSAGPIRFSSSSAGSISTTNGGVKVMRR